tara:strand:- start:3029 stop:3316 length:288 start_codon:yes stop_codon:yes gene_type:complete
MNYIEPIKEQLDSNMHDHCVMFMLIGTPTESPRWMNFGEFNNETKVLTIESTQKSGIFFNIETDFDYVEVNVFWEQFKKYRTEFLSTNYPTINPN